PRQLQVDTCACSASPGDGAANGCPKQSWFDATAYLARERKLRARLCPLLTRRSSQLAARSRCAPTLGHGAELLTWRRWRSVATQRGPAMHAPSWGSIAGVIAIAAGCAGPDPPPLAAGLPMGRQVEHGGTLLRKAADSGIDIVRMPKARDAGQTGSGLPAGQSPQAPAQPPA